MSEDRHDPRVRELTYRLMEMAPDAPPFPEEATAMTAAEKKQRPPALVWAAAAAAVVLLVGLPLILFRGGEEPAGPVTTLSTAETTTTTIADDTTTTVEEAPTTVAPTDPPSALLPITTSGDCERDFEGLEAWDPGTWYVFFGCDRPGMEDILVPRPRALMSGDRDDVGDAMIEQLFGPTSEEADAGYYAFTIEEGDAGQYVGYRVTEGDVQFEFVDFRSDPGMSNASASSASMQLLAQLSAVSFQFPEVDTVVFTFDGDCDLFWNWLQRDCTPLQRTDWEASEMGRRIAAWQGLSAGTPSTTTQAALPGEPFDIGPAEDDVVAVVGVHFGDVLNVRQGPGTEFEIVTELAPRADDVIATGRHRLLEDSIWSEVTANGTVGWVNSRFIGYLGMVDDITSSVVQSLGGIPEAETMVEMGDTVAESFRTDEGGFRFKISGAPTVGDLGEITVDVLGLADDALLGYRLHIFGQPTEGGEGFSLMSVEATSICGRGVTADGFCV